MRFVYFEFLKGSKKI